LYSFSVFFILFTFPILFTFLRQHDPFTFTYNPFSTAVLLSHDGKQNTTAMVSYCRQTTGREFPQTWDTAGGVCFERNAAGETSKSIDQGTGAFLDEERR